MASSLAPRPRLGPRPASSAAAASPRRSRLAVGVGARGPAAGVRCRAQTGGMDAHYMRRCVELARKAAGHTSPNPMVGCVLVRNGQVVGEGFHPKAGEPHAEVFALRDAGDLAENATAYVSLEPCNHYGRTPPCTEALIKAKVKEVVVGMTDPNPIVASKGIEKLQNAGIDVRVGVEEALCLRLNEAYIHRMLTGKAFATLRTTLSMNGIVINQIGSGADQPGGYHSQLVKEYDGVIISSEMAKTTAFPISREDGAKQPLYIIIAQGEVAAMGDDPIKEWILTEGKATKITGTSSIGGGCINAAQRYNTDAGSFFVKTNRRIGPAMFEGEALGLKAMYDTKSIRVPLPYKVGSLPTGGSFIIMEFIQFGRSRGDQSALGRKLAEMHKAAKSDKGYGFYVENTIGSTPQINTWTADWIEFYSKHRLGYQLELISQRFGDSAIYDKGQQLIENIHPLFDGAVIEPCLLHGDLWSGNISSDANGDPVILDPACYYGHNEAEFGMSWCAGFGGAFYNSYFEVMPKQPGFEKRRDLYLLYHYLNHYNLFGSGYRSSAMSIIEDYLRMLKA